MKPHLRAAAFFAAFLACCASAQALTPPPIAAKAFLLVDLLSGHTLAAANEDDRVEPASLTKLMTGYVVTAALLRDFPDRYSLYGQKEFTYNRITQSNRNRLLWTDPTVDGVKTGFTEQAGYCLVASARRGERRLISVVVGARSEALRTTESQKL